MAGRYIILWHGTSKSRADSILKTGFHEGSFFTKLVGIAWGYASAKRRQDDPGVLVLCAIDLSLYSKHEYDIMKERIYRFRPSIPKADVAGVFRIDRFGRAELQHKANLLRTRVKRMKRRHAPRPPEVVITRNCGSDAIAYWMNVYLSSCTDRRVDIAHPGIRYIREWIRMNYEHGRVSPISEQEMLIQAKRYVPEVFGKAPTALSGA